MIDRFKDYHPLINFLYFAFILAFNMFVLNPILQLISLLVGLTYSYILTEGDFDRRLFIYGLGLLIFSPIFNSLFNHKGGTILFYLNSGNPITLESLVYGLATGLMFINMMVWFSCYNQLMTSDKFIYIFGNIIPSLSLIITMILRFVPLYIGRIKEVYRAQQALGEEVEGEGIFDKARSGLKILSIMMTWALENSIDSSDSMRARGYGLGRRTSFSNYRMTRRDWRLLLVMLAGLVLLLRGIYLGQLEMVFFPELRMRALDRGTAYLYLVFGSLALLPIILTIGGEIRWHYLKSKI